MTIQGRQLMITKILLTALCAIGVSSQAYSLIQGQVLVGQRSASIEVSNVSEDFSGMNTKVSLYADPIPLIPIGFGLSFSDVNFGEAGAVSSLKGQEVSLDLMAWLPLPISLKPYVKLAYVLSGEYKLETSGVASTLDSKGSRIAIGAKYSLLPLLSILLEVEKSQVELEPDTGSNIEVDGLGFFVGASLGI